VAEERRRAEPDRGARGEEEDVGRRDLHVDLPDRRQVVEHPERPPVRATTRSPCLASMSRMDALGRFICSGCQWSPSSNDTKTPVSVPAVKEAAAGRVLRTTLT